MSIDSTTAGNLNKFLDIIRSYSIFYKSYHANVFLIREDNQWFILLATIKLSWEDTSKVKEEAFSIKDKISIIHIADKFDLNGFSNMVGSPNEGRLILDNTQYFIDGFKEIGLESMDNEGWKFVDLGDTEGWPADLLYCSGKQIYTLVKDLKGLNELINTNRTDAYSDLTQLSKRHMDLALMPSHSSMVYVVAPIYRKLNPISLNKSGQLSGTFNCHGSLKPSDFRLSAVYNSGIGEKVGDFHVSFKDPKIRKEFYEIKFNDTKEKRNASNAIVSLIDNTNHIRVYRKGLQPYEDEDIRSQKQFKFKGTAMVQGQSNNEKLRNNRVFICHAKEDLGAASRLYNDLKSHTNLTLWLDKDDLLPGQNWKIEIKKAIKNSRYFIVLFSSISVQKRGYMQKDVKFALEVLGEFPEGEVYAIPIKLDNCQIPYEEFNDIQRVDMFPDWNEGIQKLLRTFEKYQT